VGDAVSLTLDEVEQGSAEFPAFGNSAAFVEARTAELERQTLRYPAFFHFPFVYFALHLVGPAGG
jgi:hypothetical protein